MKFSKSIKFIALISVILFLLCYWGLSKILSTGTEVDQNIGTVKRQDLEQKITIAGTLWPRKRLDIKPPFNGYIEKIYVKIGDQVKTGSPLVTFSASLEKGETNYPVRAVFNGTVTQILKVEGEYVSESGEQNLVLRVEDLSQLFILADAPEIDITKLKVGQPATIQVTSLIGESFVGKVSEIALSAKEKDRWGSAKTEFQIKVEMESRDSRLSTGMSTLIDVITNRAQNVLVLSHEYIDEQDGSYFVTTYSDHRKKVTLGLQTEEEAEIKSGVEEGERIKIIDFSSASKVMSE
ncbi:MAG: efflux RND transporter periplasmic adaptor subunit [Bdellovibrionales bacterium]|nr:efflux RND transporter periplasmic adaptor subunit [Bdellovibrionales bacterium]